MGRPRQFSEANAIVAATAVFARRGFAGTSVDDLVRATGVNRASLYGTFGSKDGLFRRCLATALDGLAGGQSEAGRALDLVLVALMELAAGDPALAAELRRRLADAGVTAAELGARALERAGAERAG